MNWAKWVLVGYIAAQAIRAVWIVDREREPISPKMAALGLVELGAVAFLVVIA